MFNVILSVFGGHLWNLGLGMWMGFRIVLINWIILIGFLFFIFLCLNWKDYFLFSFLFLFWYSINVLWIVIVAYKT